MKTAIWLIFLVFAALWTGFVALTVQASDWLLAAMAAGQVSDVTTAATQWPVPAWLALWVDPAWVQSLQAASADMVQWLGQVLPTASGLMGWIAVLLWTGWGLGMLLLLVFAGAGHWLVGRFSASAEPRGLRT